VTAQTLRAKAAWLATALLVAGCGGGEDPQPSGRAMTAPAPVEERATNGPPSIVKIDLVPEAPRPGDPIDARVDAEDPDGDSVRVVFEWAVNGRIVEGERRPRLMTDELQKGDRVELRAVASDGLLESPMRSRAVKIGNLPPRLQGISFSGPADVRRGDPIEASPLASDPDGDVLTYSYRWYVNEKPTQQSENRFDTTDLKRGDRVHVEVVARDDSDQTKPVRSASVRVGNTPPRILGVPPVENVNGEFRYAFRADDPDGDRGLRFRLAKAPAGMTIDSDKGTARWRPDATQAGTHPVEVVVEDAYGDGSALHFEVTVTAQQGVPPAAVAR
jgi:hypothetical protein